MKDLPKDFLALCFASLAQAKRSYQLQILQAPEIMSIPNIEKLSKLARSLNQNLEVLLEMQKLDEVISEMHVVPCICCKHYDLSEECKDSCKKENNLENPELSTGCVDFETGGILPQNHVNDTISETNEFYRTHSKAIIKHLLESMLQQLL